MKKQILLILCLIFFFTCLKANEKSVIKNYVQISKSEGLTHNNVTAISEDIYGRIWIGSFTGLDIYDSRKLYHVDLFQSQEITKLFDTGKEMLIATQNSLVSYHYQNGGYQKLTFQKKDIENVIAIIYNENKTNIVTRQNLYEYKNGAVTLLKKGIISYKSVVTDKFGTIWGLQNDAVHQIRPDFTPVKIYPLTNNREANNIHAHCIFPDANGSIWIGTKKDGLYRYNRGIDAFQKEILPLGAGLTTIENIGSINEDKYSRLWIGHNSGIAVYDYGDSYLRDYMLENSYGKIENTTVTHIYKTKNGHMVTGTYFSGAFYINELISSFGFYNFSKSREDGGGIAVNGITEDEKNRIWIATNRTGVNIVDKDGGLIKQLNQSTNGIADNIISVARDDNGNIWAGSLSNGLYKIDAGENVSHYTKATGLSGNSVYAMKVLNKDSLVIGTDRGVDIYSSISKSFTNIVPAGSYNYSFIGIHSASNYIYIIDGAFIIVYDQKKSSYAKYSLDKQYPGTRILSSYITNKGGILLGTNNGKLLLFEDFTIKPYPVNGEQIKTEISGIQIDINGNIWLSSGKNLFCINPKFEVKKFNLEWGLGKNELNIRSGFSDKNGVIYLGSTDGYVKFNPQKEADYKPQNPALYITSLKVSDKTVAANNELGILSTHINETGKIVLKDNQNFISFDISIIDFGYVQSPYSLRYKLSNFDESWTKINPSSNEISYTGLPSGKYELEIQLFSSENKILATRELAIIIKSPFYISSYMLLLYAIIVAAIIFLVYRYLKKQRAAKELIIETKRKQEEADRINALKLDFFTHISHEFETPLSVISILQDDILPTGQNGNLETGIFKRNIKRLEYLISQLMEFRSIESQHTPIKYTRQNIIPFLRSISEAFAPLIKRKEIKFDFITKVDDFEMLIDASKLEMLTGNLLSNSIKLTSYGGKAHLEVTRNGDQLSINIFHSGECLTEEQKQTFFEPYNKITSSNPYASSGISLAIVNSIAKLLNIELSILPVKDQGNLFKIDIPILLHTNETVAEDNTTSNVIKEIVDNTVYIEEQHLANLDYDSNRYGYRVLIVENDHDAGQVLKKKLEKHYQVVLAFRSKDALLIMKSQNIDLLISEVQIPEIDGYELCRMVKQNENTKHIPIALITSERTPEAKMKGFQNGADAFLQKPINVQELVLRLDNILKRKGILREYYSAFKLPNEDAEYFNNADELFLKNISNYIYDHLSDVELSVQQLAAYANVSRTQLYLNIKRLSGKTPSDFILNIKMQEAQKLLLSANLTTSEISYKLGYRNPNHFSRQFKEYVGHSPRKFKTNNGPGT